jgi:hypothetical protein
MENKFYRITVEHPEFPEEKIIIQISNEATIHDMTQAFKTILTWMTYNHETIKEAFAEEE